MPYDPRGRSVVAGILASLTLLTGCAAPEGKTDSQEEAVRVAAGFYPLRFLAERVGGPDAEVTDLTPAGTEPHDLSLTGPARAAAQDAEVLVYVGNVFQPDVSEVVEQRTDTGQMVDILAVPGIDLLAPSATIPFDESYHEHQSGESDVDPHVWLDPVRTEKIVDVITESLARVRPNKRAAFERRRDEMRAQLRQLHAEFRSATTHCASSMLITNHAAFGYLADRYDLDQLPIAGLSPEQEPDPAAMGRIAEVARRSGTRTIFAEAERSSKLSHAVAQHADAQVALLATLEFAPTAEDGVGGNDYLSRMHANARAIKNGLGCR